MEEARELELVQQDIKDILKNCHFDTKEDLFLCEDIINHIEKEVAENFKARKICNIPYIGCIRFSPVKEFVDNNGKQLHEIRKTMTSDEYKLYFKSKVTEVQIKDKEKEKRKLFLKRIRINNRSKYEELYKTVGKAYAECFIFCLSLMTIVPFDEDLQAMYDNLKD